MTSPSDIGPRRGQLIHIGRAVRQHLLRFRQVLRSFRRRVLVGPYGRLRLVRAGALDFSRLGPETRRAPLVIEVGANSGEDTLRILDFFTGAHVLCFEPDPRAIRNWRATVTNPRADLFPLAIGRECGEATFYQSGGLPPGATKEDFPEGWDLSGSIITPKNHTIIHPWSNFTSGIRVRIETLDSVATKFLAGQQEVRFPVGLLWADVQGAERELIAGARQTLEATQYFYTEYSNDELYEGQPRLDELEELLPNFRVARLWANDVLFENKRFRPISKTLRW